MNTHFNKAEALYNLHQQEQIFVMPNAWDAGSAKLLAAAGFVAIATTSAGIAFSLGRPDSEGAVSRAEMLNALIRKAATEMMLEGRFSYAEEQIPDAALCEFFANFGAQ
ncbi:MAG: hypothetical protein E6Q83_07230 [Thiothrix sp.]|nr:MAG: hypothetical protein E6Q83_07230 [Thiothrix sp.]